MKKKVLILVNHEIVIYNFRLELVNRLLKDNYEVYISTPSGPKIDILKNMGCKIIDTAIDRHSVNPLKEFKLLFKYFNIFKEINPDVVLTYTIKPNIYGGIISKLKNTPLIANITGLGIAVENESLLSKITLSLYKFAFSSIRTIFFQNKENMALFEQKQISNSKYKLLPGSGVNLDYFSLQEYPDDSKVEFIFISRIMKEKGIDQYLEAAEIISKKYKNSVFHICGFLEGDYEKIIDEATKNEQIIYHGMVSDIRTILNSVNCTVHPTYYPEGLSNVLLESAATGKPLISTNRSGTKEVIDDGETGFLIEAKNTKDLVGKIEYFINMSYSEKKEMGLKGRNKVEKEFDRQIVVNEYMKEIEEVIYGI